jgi:hypothetical protein
METHKIDPNRSINDITIRCHIATQCLSALLSNKQGCKEIGPEAIAEMAVLTADALIQELNKNPVYTEKNHPR